MVKEVKETLNTRCGREEIAASCGVDDAAEQMAWIRGLILKSVTI